jgi:hypothetical protein
MSSDKQVTRYRPALMRGPRQDANMVLDPDGEYVTVAAYEQARADERKRIEEALLHPVTLRVFGDHVKASPTIDWRKSMEAALASLSSNSETEEATK